MLGLSTSFFSKKNITGHEILEKTTEFNIKYLELEYRLSRESFFQIKNALKSFDITVTSLHNYCYRDDTIMREDDADADFFRLSAHDNDEREKAVRYTRKTFENADAIGASTIVLHLGDAGQDKERDMLRGLIDNNLVRKDEGKHFLKNYLEERKHMAGRCLEQVFRSIDELIPTAEKYGLKIGVENRYYLHQLPDFNEMEKIFSEFKGAPLGFWLDFGHAHVNSLWGLHGIDEYIEAFGSSMVGAHVHDAAGRSDHRPPGSGEIDLKKYISSLKDDIPLILEIASSFSDENLLESIAYITAMGE
jgi:sugar phosphate isomerase/epimerase